MTQEEFFKRYTYSPSRDRIGGGGFGTVYKAKDTVLHRELAIKVSEVKTTPDGQKTFSLKDEFEALSHVPKHPNIANYEEFYSYESPQGLFDYAVMQYYPDGNLSHAIKQGLTAEQKEDIATQLLEGIDFLHKHKVVHRDLKPGNILIVRDGDKIIPLITDFGLSKAAGVVDGSVFTNSFGGGTPRYSSPEQLQGQPLRLNTDLWSYGAILYELFTGEQLFSAGSGAANTAQADLEIYNKIVNGDVSGLGKMPETWRKVAERCLVVDPTKRAKDAETLLYMVRDADDETELGGPTDPGRLPPSQRGAGGIPKTPAGSSNRGSSTPSTGSGTAGSGASASSKGTSSNTGRHSGPDPLSPKQGGTHKPKTGLWIGLGVAAAAVVALVVLLAKPKPTPTDPDTQAYQACHTVADYRAYMRDYGRNALHYDEAKQQVDAFVADSTAKAQALLAEQQAKEKAEAEAQAQAEAEQKEEAAYRKCTTVAGCDSYLKAYPKGKYVEEVKARKAELEEDEAYNKCTTIAACESYLKAYPQGRYAAEVNKKKAELEKAEEKPPTTQPSGSSITLTANGVSFVMKRVAGGTFRMGSDDSEAWDDEKPVHSVTVSTFHMGETEVTQALWKAVMGSNPSNWKGDNLPVESVSWDDCQEFIRKLNSLTGKSFRLPTEAEWEYAARGGSRRNGTKYAGSGSIGSVAWYTDNSGSKTHPVKGKSPNELGLYDMSGNVWEWCGDWYGAYGSGSQTNPKGPSAGSYRVLRGGSWIRYAECCRVSYRYFNSPVRRNLNPGFRLVLPQ